MAKDEQAVTVAPGAELVAWAREQLADADTGETYEPKAVLLAIMAKEPLPKRDAVGTIDGILARILDAGSFDEAIAASETMGIDAILGHEVMLDKPRWFPSAYESGSLVFCVAEAVDMDSGLVQQVVIGSQQPLVAIWRAEAEGRFPFVCRFRQSAKPTASGFYPYNLTR